MSGVEAKFVAVVPPGDARVSVELGATINMGNYESARVSVGITLPCQATPAAIEAAYTQARDMAQQGVNKEVELARNARRSLVE